MDVVYLHEHKYMKSGSSKSNKIKTKGVVYKEEEKKGKRCAIDKIIYQLKRIPPERNSGLCSYC